MTQLQYIGTTLKHTNNDLPEVHYNIGKVRVVWIKLVKLLKCEVADIWLSDLFYKLVI